MLDTDMSILFDEPINISVVTEKEFQKIHGGGPLPLS